MKYIFTLVILNILTISAFSQINFETRFDDLTSKYGISAIKATYFIDATRDILKKIISTEDDNICWDDFEMKMQNFSSQNIHLLKSKLANINNKKHGEIIDSIVIWCEIDRTLDMPFLLKNTKLTEFTEVISNIESTKHLIDKYIKTDNQYWGSLTSSQMTEVYYELRNQIFKTNSIEQLNFFKIYFETISKLNN